MKSSMHRLDLSKNIKKRLGDRKYNFNIANSDSIVLNNLNILLLGMPVWGLLLYRGIQKDFPNGVFLHYQQGSLVNGSLRACGS